MTAGQKAAKWQQNARTFEQAEAEQRPHDEEGGRDRVEHGGVLVRHGQAADERALKGSETARMSDQFPRYPQQARRKQEVAQGTRGVSTARASEYPTRYARPSERACAGDSGGAATGATGAPSSCKRRRIARVRSTPEQTA